MGSLLLFDTTEPALRISLQVLIPAVVVVSAFFIFVIWLAIKAQRREHFSGAEAMLSTEAEAVTDIVGEGQVFLQGEYWKATSEKPIKKGAKVRIIKVEGLNLNVEEIKKEQ
jgi:membrane-bound serine protease (ClpP class)